MELLDGTEDPIALLRADRLRARARADAHAEFACLATFDPEQGPQARTVTLRTIEQHSVLVTAHASSPKCQQLTADARCQLLIYWASLARQYRLAATAQWIAASDLPELYAHAPLRARAWDLLHQELPQSAVSPDRAAFVTRFEQLARTLEGATHAGSSPAVPAGAGYLRLHAQVVEIQTLDLDRRVHDRHRFERSDRAWRHSLLVP